MRMPSRTAVVVLVLLIGYAMYGGLFVAAGAIHGSLSDGGNPTDAVEVPGQNGTVGSVDSSGELTFDGASIGLNYSYVVAGNNFDKGSVITNAGVYAADYDSDGWTDILAIGGDHPVLFENVGGAFEPSGALPDVERDVRAALWVDYNVDGRPDLVLLGEGVPPLLLENVGDGFERKPSTFDEPTAVPKGATTADYNSDGCPDLFVYQNGDWSDRLPLGFRNYSVPPNADNGNPNRLYRGSCSGFERVSEAGIQGERWTLAASFVDITGDGYPDIHAANDINHDIAYLNQRNGSFEQVVLPERTNRHGMASEIADVTGNGRLDMFVTNIFYPEWAAERIKPDLTLKARGNALIEHQGDGVFVLRGEQYGVRKGGFGWAAVIADFDNDGDEDLFHTTQTITFEGRDLLFSDGEIKELQGVSYYSVPALWERTDSASFRQRDAERAGFGVADGRGVARVDYDRDGDLDLVVATTGQYRVYENVGTGGNAVQLRVLGHNRSQTAAYGTTVSVSAGEREQQRRVHARTDFLSQDSRLVHVGVGNQTRGDIRVVWPDGTTRSFNDVPVGRQLVVTPDGIQRSQRGGPG